MNVLVSSAIKLSFCTAASVGMLLRSNAHIAAERIPPVVALEHPDNTIANDGRTSIIADTLVVSGEGIKTVRLTRSDLAQMPRKQVKVKDFKSGALAVFEGVAINDILQRMRAPMGKALNHKELSKFLVVEAHDGYRVVFALAELEPLFTDNTVILADTKNGDVLDSYSGAFCIIVPQEKKHSRWVRQVKALILKGI